MTVRTEHRPTEPGLQATTHLTLIPTSRPFKLVAQAIGTSGIVALGISCGGTARPAATLPRPVVTPEPAAPPPPTARRLALRLPDSTAVFSGHVTVITREDSPFPLHTDTTSRSDSSTRQLNVVLVFADSGNVLNVSARIDTGLVEFVRVIDSSGTPIWTDSSEPCSGDQSSATGVLASLLVPPRDTTTAGVQQRVLTENRVGCVSKVALGGSVEVSWSNSSDTATPEALAQLSGTLSADSTRAVPVHLTASVGGLARLRLNAIELLPTQAEISVEFLFRARNSRVDQRIRQTIVYSLVRQLD